MATIDLGKVAITTGGNWNNAVSYEALTIVLYATANGGDGCSYISKKNCIGVTPGTDSSVWMKVTEVGASIYELAVKYGYEGTEAEFVAEYIASVAAANSAAETALAAKTTIDTAEAARVTAENGRASAETARASAESARASAETSRAAAESSRVSAESSRQSASATAVADAGTATGLCNRATEAAIAAISAANTAARAANTAAEAANTAAAGASALQNNIENGTVVAALAKNIESWEDRDALSVEDTNTDIVRTTAGDVSIDSGEAAALVSIVAKTNFYASAFKCTGFNLLRFATAIGDGYYFLVPALPWGSYGTAVKPNGLLFTDSNNDNLKPTVLFKALSDGVPSSASDGTACPYTDSNGKRFYNPASAGYIIVSGITLASTCAHVAWSRRYDEYVAVNASGDAGDYVTLSTIIASIHNTNLMYVAGSVSDRIDFTATKAIWTRNVDRVVPTWTTTNDGEGNYTHTATITAMKLNGAVECTGIALVVDGNTISYTDNSSSATDAYVYYELATPAAGNSNLSNELTVEDWGLEYLEGATGSAYITIQYAQGYPDSVATMIAGGLDTKLKVIAQAIATLSAEVEALTKGKNRLGKATADSIDALEITKALHPLVLYGNGVPAAATTPGNLPKGLPWDGIPAFIGQIYINTAVTSGGLYYAVGISAVSDWKLA